MILAGWAGVFACKILSGGAESQTFLSTLSTFFNLAIWDWPAVKIAFARNFFTEFSSTTVQLLNLVKLY